MPNPVSMPVLAPVFQVELRIQISAFFIEAGEVDAFMQCGKQAAEVFWRQHAGSAAAEIEGSGFGGGLRDSVAGFPGERVDEAADRSGARGVLVERAIRADPVAEGDMEVEQQGVSGISGERRIGKGGFGRGRGRAIKLGVF